jgi:hypothetical protein
LARDELLQGILGFFTERTGVRALFQDASGYTIASATEVPSFCSMLINYGRCGLLNPEVEMPADAELPDMRMCMGGIGHLVIPIRSTGPTGQVTELGRVITEPLAIRETDFTETFAEAERLKVHPDNLSTAAREIKVVDRAELTQLADLIAMVADRVARDRNTLARNLALAEAFEDVGLRGNREVIDELLTSLVKNFTDADAAILTTSGDGEHLQHSPTFGPEVDEAKAELILEFTGEVTRWIAHTGYPISFPDLGGSAWCRHVLQGRPLEGALAAVPIKLLGGGHGWWTAYYRHPMSQMEDELHRLSVLAAHTAHTLGFLERLEASQEQAVTDSLQRPQPLPGIADHLRPRRLQEDQRRVRPPRRRRGPQARGQGSAQPAAAVEHDLPLRRRRVLHPGPRMHPRGGPAGGRTVEGRDRVPAAGP